MQTGRSRTASATGSHSPAQSSGSSWTHPYHYALLAFVEACTADPVLAAQFRHRDTTFGLAQHCHDLRLGKSAPSHSNLLNSRYEKILLPHSLNYGEDYHSAARDLVVAGMRESQIDISPDLEFHLASTVACYMRRPVRTDYLTTFMMEIRCRRDREECRRIGDDFLISLAFFLERLTRQGGSIVHYAGLGQAPMMWPE